MGRMVKKKFVFKVTGGDEGFRKGGEILFFILLVGGWGCVLVGVW